MSSMRSASSITSDLAVVEQDAAAVEHIHQSAGSGDQHVDAAVERLLLVAEGFAADQERHGQLVIATVFLEILGDLGREFAGRLENQ